MIKHETTPFLKYVEGPKDGVGEAGGAEEVVSALGDTYASSEASDVGDGRASGEGKRAGKADLIASIRARSRGVGTDYLMKFDEPALRNYLDRLLGLSGPRGAKAVWVRRAETPAIVVRRVWPRRGLMPAS